jgi:hypothetical protein
MHRKIHFNLIVYIFILFLLLNISAYISEAVREGTSNANMMIRRYERKGQFGKAALWHEAAAECLDVISIPLTEMMLKYHRLHKNKELAEKVSLELKAIEVQRRKHLQKAKLNWDKARKNKEELDAERMKIAKFIAEWAPYYPDRFYQFGVYENIFKNRIESLKKAGKFKTALIVSAEAAEMAAEQYTLVTIGYFARKAEEAEKAGSPKLTAQYLSKVAAYQQVRDDHLKRASMLRALAKQNPDCWPKEADKRDLDVPQSKHKFNEKEVKKLAREDERVQKILSTPECVLEFASFQGFGWTIAYYTRGWYNLGIAFIDDKNGKVTDVLVSPGELEEREWDREEQEEQERLSQLKLTSEQVTRIARKNEQSARFLTVYPNAKIDAAFNWEYNCWVVEFIVDDREVGIVTVSDETGEVLEVSFEHHND